MTTQRPIGKLARRAIALAGVAFVAGYLLAGARPAATDSSARSAAAAPDTGERVDARSAPALGGATALPAIRMPQRAASANPRPTPPAATTTSAAPPSPPAPPPAPAPPPPPAPSEPPAPAPAADPPTAATPAPTFDSPGESFDSSG